MAVGEIPWTAIERWAEVEFGDDREAKLVLITVIRRLDVDFISAMRAEQQKDKTLGANRARGRT